MQLAKVEPFIPKGNGMEDDGRTVVQGIFDRGICVDLKHMSYKSRLDLMNEIDAGNFQNVQPLLCTHAGFTGIPFSHWPGYISLKKPASGAIYLEIAKSMQTWNEPQTPGAPAFNMATINLFDEEIAWIVNNNGIIGISLDRRIIGYVGKFDESPTGIRDGMDLIVDREFLSKDEWASLGIPNNQIGKRIQDGDCVTMGTLEESTEISVTARNEYFLDHILLHLKHYFQACVNANISIAKAKKHITIGSDFDGLINPFLNLGTVEEMANLKRYISMNLGFYLNKLKDSKQWVNELDIPAFVEDLFYNNGYEFVKSRL
jgi:microsomal dipeptidase-like Zn-dependent dipeptidase